MSQNSKIARSFLEPNSPTLLSTLFFSLLYSLFSLLSSFYSLPSTLFFSLSLISSSLDTLFSLLSTLFFSLLSTLFSLLSSLYSLLSTLFFSLSLLSTNNHSHHPILNHKNTHDSPWVICFAALKDWFIRHSHTAFFSIASLTRCSGHRLDLE